VITIKKYGNRRLYDSDASRYVTLEEIAATIRAGRDVRVLDAKTSQDLTQATLAQIILESRGAASLLPVPVLVRLIRLGDDALAEFFGSYVSWALETYLHARSGALAMAPYNPFAAMTAPGAGAFGRMMGGYGEPAPPPPPPRAPAAQADDVASLRRELDELRRAVERKPKKR
jgi:polyhydroxyalkanoate synthesis repressor PhaR